MTVMNGTDKQIAAATQIRDTWVAKAQIEAERLAASKSNNPQRKAYGERLARAVEIAPTIASAAFWLDNRYTFERGPLGSTAGADLVIEQSR